VGIEYGDSFSTSAGLPLPIHPFRDNRPSETFQ
jgi:hypothetical protein